jgi:hypothetical protein
VRVALVRVTGRTLTRIAWPRQKRVAARTRLWLAANGIGGFARTCRPTTLTRRLLDYLILDFRMGAGPLPAKDLLQVLQCAIAARDDLDRGLEGAVSVCFVQD